MEENSKILTDVKPRTARAKREAEKRAPQIVETGKKTLILKGQKASQVVHSALSDLYRLKLPMVKRFTKKNDIRPFEDATSMEFFAERNDTSLMIFGHHSKKRPHSLTFIRFFDFKVLDMLELYIEPNTFRTLSQFKAEKCTVGSKPLISFSGMPFESPLQTPYTLAKNMFVDFFRGVDIKSVDLEALQHMIQISAEDEVLDDQQPAPSIRIRVYRLISKKSGQSMPLIELEEIGPRIDFRVGRVMYADEAVMKQALKQPKYNQAKSKKNIHTDILGDKLGKIHVERQNLDKLQTRKVKSLKKRRRNSIEDNMDDQGMIDDDKNSSSPKRLKNLVFSD